MAIDAHLHAFGSADEGRLAQGGEPQCGFDGTVAELVDLLDRGVLDGACAMSALPVRIWHDVLGSQWEPAEAGDRLMELAAAQNDTLCDTTAADPRLWCAIGAEALLPAHPQVAHLDAALRAHRHVRAVKIHPSLNHTDPDDAGYTSVYQFAAEAGLPVVSHGGTSAGTMYESPVERCRPDRFAPVAAAHPRLSLIVAHCAAPWLDELGALGVAYPNVYTDLSWVLPARLVDPPRLGAFIRSFGVERVLFGSDWPYFDPAAALDALADAGLTPAETDQVTAGNAARLLRL